MAMIFLSDEDRAAALRSRAYGRRAAARSKSSTLQHDSSVVPPHPQTRPTKNHDAERGRDVLGCPWVASDEDKDYGFTRTIVRRFRCREALDGQRTH